MSKDRKIGKKRRNDLADVLDRVCGDCADWECRDNEPEYEDYGGPYNFHRVMFSIGNILLQAGRRDLAEDLEDILRGEKRR